MQKNKDIFPPSKIRTDKIIKVEENGREYILENKNKLEVFETHVDGDLYKKAEDGKRCDFALYSKEYKTVILIELKGSHLEKWLKQIEATFNDFNKNFHFSFNKYYARIVLSKVKTTKLPRNDNKQLIKDFEKKGISLKYGTRTITDYLNANFTLKE